VGQSDRTTVEGGLMQIAPSILAADFARLADEIALIGADADWVHVDVMDNHFVPNLTLGLPVVEALLKHSPLPMDCHLMIDDPDRWAPAYAEAGAASVTFHAEAAGAPVRLARALQPATPIEAYADLLPEIDTVLIMSVEPGFGGQSFLDIVLPKVRRARELVREGEHSVWIQMDGGVDEDTIARCAEAGADVFVAGSSVYGSDDPADAIRKLRDRAQQAGDAAWWAS
jgi:ribulose-phosphate 3-epimerase